MVLVNGLTFTAGNRQNEIKPAGDKNTSADSFYDFLSRSINAGEAIKTADNNRIKPMASSGNRSAAKNESVADGVRVKNTVSRGDSEEISEITVPDTGSSKKTGKDIVYIIDEMIALLKMLAILLKNPENTDVSAGSISVPEDIKAALNNGISSLAELTGITGGDVGELVQELKAGMQKLLAGDSAELIVENGLASKEEQAGELIAKLLNEAENLKEMIVSGNPDDTVNAVNSEDSGILTGDNSSIQQQEKFSVTGQDNRGEQKPDTGIREENEEQKASADDEVTIPGRNGVNTVSFQEDVSKAGEIRNIRDGQADETGYVTPERFTMIEKNDILHQVAEKFQVLTDNERSEMIIHLKPESLGKIQLQVIHERGEIIARFVAENEQVKSILESNMQFLRDELEKSGVDIQSLSVSVGQQDRSNDRSDYKDLYPQSSLHRIYQEELPDMTSVPHTYLYTGIADDLYRFTGSEINLIA